jgi:hypothetical protein
MTYDHQIDKYAEAYTFRATAILLVNIIYNIGLDKGHRTFKIYYHTTFPVPTHNGANTAPT